ncbi:MAG: glycogen/starch synthase [Bacteroidota bacterium]|nr:glycogen/starch synthase [Bacteroidota bacterium]
MENKNILFVSQEITPYLPESPMSNLTRFLPQAIQEGGNEVRVFMPRYGKVNERRNKLHEVIRLSGMNLIIDDLDHSLIIKVASIQAARMQVYFIDNEEYFKRKLVVTDKNGDYFDDNDERMIFFGRGVLETVKKLRWTPDLVHCHGWMSALVPLFTKTMYKDDPLFEEAKVIYSIYSKGFDNKFDASFKKKILSDDLKENHIKDFEDLDYAALTELALKFSDGVIIGDEEVEPEILEIAKKSGLPILEYQGEEDYEKAYSDFYQQIIGE